MKSSVLKEAISAMFVKKPRHNNDAEGSNSLEFSSDSSYENSPSSSNDSSPAGSNQNSRKNSPNPEEAKPSTLKKKSRYTFYSTSLVEHKIIQPGSDCLPFPWTHDQSTKTRN